jgi:predicted DNA-binding transcriptional regulator AlpA
MFRESTHEPTDDERTDPLITVTDITKELSITRNTWNKWRATGQTPLMHRLPNRSLRCRRSDFDQWVASFVETRSS